MFSSLCYTNGLCTKVNVLQEALKIMDESVQINWVRHKDFMAYAKF